MLARVAGPPGWVVLSLQLKEETCYAKTTGFRGLRSGGDEHNGTTYAGGAGGTGTIFKLAP